MTVYKKAARTHTCTHTLAHQAILIPIGIHQTLVQKHTHVQTCTHSCLQTSCLSECVFVLGVGCGQQE